MRVKNNISSTFYSLLMVAPTPHPEQIAIFSFDVFVFWCCRLGGYFHKLNPPGNPPAVLLRPARDPRAEELAEPKPAPDPP